jgi:two-component system OmpR family response regulator
VWAAILAVVNRRVLIVDPDPLTRELHRMALTFVGHDVRVVASSNDAELLFDGFAPDVVVLTVDIGPEDATRFRDRLVRSGDPVRQVVIVGDHADRRRAGAAVVLARPLDLDALVAAVEGGTGGESTVSVGTLELDRRRERVVVAGQEVHLSPTEFRLLRLLAINAERVLSKADILDQVWRYDFGGRTNAVETYVSYLRRKLGPLGGPSIVTVRGAGYVLRA